MCAGPQQIISIRHIFIAPSCKFISRISIVFISILTNWLSLRCHYVPILKLPITFIWKWPTLSNAIILWCLANSWNSYYITYLLFYDQFWVRSLTNQFICASFQQDILWSLKNVPISHCTGWLNLRKNKQYNDSFWSLMNLMIGTKKQKMQKYAKNVNILFHDKTKMHPS